MLYAVGTKIDLTQKKESVIEKQIDTQKEWLPGTRFVFSEWLKGSKVVVYTPA